MGPSLRRRLLAGSSLVALCLSLIIGRPWAVNTGAAWSALAVPDDAFASLGLDKPDSLHGVDDFPVRLSDFSRVETVPLGQALARAGLGDPRRTPLLDALASRFVAQGPQGRLWRVMYADRPTNQALGRFIEALEAAGVEYAATSKGGGSLLAALPAAAFAAFAAYRKRRTDLIVALAFAAAAAPPIASLTPAGALAGIAIVASAAIAVAPFSGFKLGRRLAYGFPAAALAAGALAWSPSIAPSLVMSASLLGLAASAKPGALRARLGLREPPGFVAISASTAAKELKRISAIAGAACLAVVAAASVGGGSSETSALRHDGEYRIEFAGGGLDDAAAMVEAHAAYQDAITYGRLGDAAWGSSGFSPAYRYTESGGRLVRGEPDRSKPEGGNSGAWTAEDTRRTVRLLGGPKPARITKRKQ